MGRDDQFIPHLIVSDGMAALKFYEEVFGGVVGHNLMAGDGKRLMHGDPFGHIWGINQQWKEQAEEETNAAAKEFFQKQK